MTNTTTTAPATAACANGNLIRLWTDDTVVNVQLTTLNGVELAAAALSGLGASDTAGAVVLAWLAANAA